MTKQTQTGNWNEIAKSIERYTDETVLGGAKLTEAEAYKMAAAINDALRQSGNYTDGFEDNGANMKAMAVPTPTGERRGLIEIVGDDWHVVIGSVDGPILMPEYFIGSAMHVTYVAHSILLAVDDADAVNNWYTEWIAS